MINSLLESRERISGPIKYLSFEIGSIIKWNGPLMLKFCRYLEGNIGTFNIYKSVLVEKTVSKAYFKKVPVILKAYEWS